MSRLSGMTINERFWEVGLSPAWNAAVECGDRHAMIRLLGWVELADQAESIADILLRRCVSLTTPSPTVPSIRRTDTRLPDTNAARGRYGRLDFHSTSPCIRALPDPPCHNLGAGSTGRCNTNLQFICWRLKAQGLPGAVIEAQGDLVEMGLRVDGQVSLLRKVSP